MSQKAPPAARPTGRTYKFTVDGRHLEVSRPTLTGAEIKALAGADPSVGLFLEGRGHAADRAIADGDVVDFAEPGREQFYTAPPANFGA
jgi:hypothetical protein